MRRFVLGVSVAAVVVLAQVLPSLAQPAAAEMITVEEAQRMLAKAAAQS